MSILDDRSLFNRNCKLLILVKPEKNQLVLWLILKKNLA